MISGEDLPAAKRLAPAIGMAERPLGPAHWNHVSPRDFYRAVLEDIPHPVRDSSGSAQICCSLTAIRFADALRWPRWISMHTPIFS